MKCCQKFLRALTWQFLEQDNNIIIFPDPNKEAGPKVPTFTVSGYIRDAVTGEELIGGTLLVQETGSGTGTNPYGFYSLTLQGGRYNLKVRHLGYQTKDTILVLDRKKTVDISLQPTAFQLLEVLVKATDEDKELIKRESDYQSISVEDINTMPAIFGEQDIMQGLQLLPGVLATGEASGGISVRGAASDQNLILLDEAPIYNTSHLFGVFFHFQQ